MSAPRQVLPGVTYLVTRRCLQRRYLLRPSKRANEVFLYVLAVAASRFGILVHAYCVLSNHYHLVVTDPHAHLPAFLQLLDALVARAVNSSLSRRETFWAPGSFNAVTLADSEAIVDKTAYVLANPVAAGLVRVAAQWPGLWSAPEAIGGGARTVCRPAHFFSPNGPMPESVVFELTPPPGWTAEEFRERTARSLGEREEAAARSPRGFLGVLRVLAQRPTDRPGDEEPRRAMRPKVASRDRDARVRALRRLALFLDAYREALVAWRAGARDTLFPGGTYWMRVVHGVACSGAG